MFFKRFNDNLQNLERNAFTRKRVLIPSENQKDFSLRMGVTYQRAAERKDGRMDGWMDG